MNQRKNRKLLIEVLNLLRDYYPGSKIALNFTNSYELLFATILSAQCTDKRVNIVTKSLFKKYKKLEDYANATDLENDIKSINFYRNKAKNIKNSACLIISKFNSLVPSNMADLIMLPGVSRKTANVVLHNWFNLVEGIVVDTHVLRVSSRLSLTRSKNPKIVESDLMKILEKSSWKELSHLFISLGRDKCKAKKPNCYECPLSKICPSAFSFF